MTEGSDSAPAAPEPSLHGVLPEVVKGLKDKPALLFGIGAGVILVAVLAATTEVWLVLIVAAVLLLALAAWVFGDARRRRDDETGVKNVVRAKGLKKQGDGSVGVVDTSSAAVENVVDVRGAEITGTGDVGVVRNGRSRRRKPS